MNRYKLTLNRYKTRLIRFGRKWGGKGGPKSGTFDFLRFTHIAGKDRKGRYLVRRKTASKRLRLSVKVIVQWCRKHRHQPIRWQWLELDRKLRGYYEYYGIRGNFEAMARFRHLTRRAWLNALRRRGQKVNIKRLSYLFSEVFPLPIPKNTHFEGWLKIIVVVKIMCR